MNALKDSEIIPKKVSPIRPLKPSRNAPIAMERQVQRYKKIHRNSYIEQGFEVTIKIIINGLLTVVAFTTLTKLLPYYQSQQKELAKINHEVHETEVRVNKLRERFSRNFDSSQTKKIMEKNTYKVDPNKRPIIFLNNSK